MSAMVRMPVELKERLEELKEKHGKKTIYDMVEHLMHTVEQQKSRILDMQREQEAEERRRKAEYAHLGTEVKKQLTEFQSHVNLGTSAQAVEFLIACYDGAMSVNKIAFDTYVRLSRRGES